MVFASLATVWPVHENDLFHQISSECKQRNKYKPIEHDVVVDVVANRQSPARQTTCVVPISIHEQSPVNVHPIFRIMNSHIMLNKQ